LIAEDDQSGVEGRAEIDNRLADQFVEPGLV
jgi:hypothetical protein